MLVTGRARTPRGILGIDLSLEGADVPMLEEKVVLIVLACWKEFYLEGWIGLGSFVLKDILPSKIFYAFPVVAVV